jgi:hypothetical protein
MHSNSPAPQIIHIRKPNGNHDEIIIRPGVVSGPENMQLYSVALGSAKGHVRFEVNAGEMYDI